MTEERPAEGRAAWTVGVASFTPDSGAAPAFFAGLHHRIVSALSRDGCRCRTYVRRERPGWPQQLDDFPGLDVDVSEGALNGLVMLTNLAPAAWDRLASCGVAACHVGPFTDVPCGVAIDFDDFARDAAELLARLGCRHLAVSDFLSDALACADEGDAPTGRVDGLPRCQGLDAGREAARLLLERPAEERPDGLVLADDYATMGLSEVLAQAEDYWPVIAAVTNRQVPLSYAIPVLCWELDLDELAVHAMHVLRALLRGVEGLEVERIAPRRVPAGKAAPVGSG